MSQAGDSPTSKQPLPPMATGQRYGRLVVIEFVRIDGKRSLWRFRCDCGSVRVIRATSVRQGVTTSCGCGRLKSPPMTAGQRHGRLVVIEFVDRPRGRSSRWKFRCDCGKDHVAWAANVRRGRTESCGCARSIAPGQRFARLVALKRIGVDHRREAKWRFRCDCGNTVMSPAGNVRSGHTRSCGCLLLSLSRARIVHGMSRGSARTPEYRAWNALKNRCTNPKNVAFRNYGGRGIAVCDEWLNSFVSFYRDMGPRPSSKHSIDRYPDNDGPYSKENCRWATRKQQNSNKRKVGVLKHFRTADLLAEVARRTAART